MNHHPPTRTNYPSINTYDPTMDNVSIVIVCAQHHHNECASTFRLPSLCLQIRGVMEENRMKEVKVCFGYAPAQSAPSLLVWSAFC
jgi:hypothetical protein